MALSRIVNDTKSDGQISATSPTGWGNMDLETGLASTLRLMRSPGLPCHSRDAVGWASRAVRPIRPQNWMCSQGEPLVSDTVLLQRVPDVCKVVGSII